MAKRMTRAQFLLSRGWKRHLASWWFKPLPGWGGRLAVNGQQVFHASRAFEMERLRLRVPDTRGNEAR
jgi:hypothetical protein